MARLFAVALAAACIGLAVARCDAAFPPLQSLPTAEADVVVATTANNNSYVFGPKNTFQLSLGTGTWATLAGVSDVAVCACVWLLGAR